MSTPAPALKSVTGTPASLPAARSAAPEATVGEPKGAARQGVRTACSPAPHGYDGRRPFAWLHVIAPRGAAPTATSRCACGRDRSAVGRARVLALIADHTSHRTVCPLRHPQEGRAAA
ncbi:hypothetical protein [Streptomyces dubilierae]|uniref:Uncharacterized protein n=1 Tax=Streptomyces dubilierae TaxID=3075533 RepID=A0ABU2P7Y7_9ACTN|nr:hypothetical protein [Streptomyces sp. DSM 41921]MDT0388258.1 hypothetical protein [Streptomyces sp. DSM 41921]